jgi:hypothetical protein
MRDGSRYDDQGTRIPDGRTNDQGGRWRPGDGPAFDPSGGTGGWDGGGSDSSYVPHGD